MKMKYYTCWVVKRSEPSSTMPHALIKMAAYDLHGAQAMAAVLSAAVLSAGLSVWHETVSEMSGLGGDALRPLAMRINGEDHDNWWGDFMVAGRSKQEAMANTLELAAWLQDTGVSIDVAATLAQPEWTLAQPSEVA